MSWSNGLPTYGNWGGPGWSAGGHIPSGTDVTAEQWKVPGIDKLDELFKEHDRAYEDAKNQSASDAAKAILAADLRLLARMNGLDPNDPNSYQDPAVGRAYQMAAEAAFTDKVLSYDIPLVWFGGVSDGVSNAFTSSQTWVPRRDPLTFDLDGDGIETIALSNTNPILFDINGDGVKTATGWIKPDDGFLVLDRGGNDTLLGGAGADILAGETGDDKLYAEVKSPSMPHSPKATPNWPATSKATGSTATPAMTPSSATPATTPWRAEMAKTSCSAAAETTT